MSVPAASVVRDDGFCHDAFVYRGEAEFVAGCVEFIAAGLAADEPVLVAVIPPKERLLRAALGADAHRVRFADMARLGQNPARIIPAWRDFLATQYRDGRKVRGIGEPIWAGRRPAEVVEAQLHEALLNLAFDGGPGWRLRCPYDADALDPAVLDGAYRNHAVLVQPGGERDSQLFGGHQPARSGFRASLPEPSSVADVLCFQAGEVTAARGLVLGHARKAGLDPARADALALAAQELATNSIRHGGGRGTIRVWYADRALVVEVRDAGRIRNPLAGRQFPGVTAEGGRGLWLVNQLCDLVQLRSSGQGTVVRIFTWLD